MLAAQPEGCRRFRAQVWFGMVGEGRGGGRVTHLPSIDGALVAWVGSFPAHVEEHVVLPGGQFLHEVGRKHPCPEDDAVILEATYRRGPEE